MELTHRFTVPAPIDEAWATFNDLERIAPCFPGAALTSYDGEQFEGLCKVKLGPVSLQYAGSGRFVQRDEAAHRAVIEAKGKDKRGNGTAAAEVRAELSPAGDDRTEVVMTTDLNVTGRPAQFGRGMMQDVSDRLLAQFTTCLETKLGEQAAPAGEAEPAEAESTGEPSSSAAGETAAAAATGVAGRPVARPVAEPSAPPPSELDLGATVLPVLVKRLAPFAIAALVVLIVLRTVRRRRS